MAASRWVAPLRGGQHDKDDKDDADDAAEDDTEDEAGGFVAFGGGEGPEAGGEVLGSGDDAEQQAVEGEGDVVELDGGGQTVVAGGVLGADEGAVVEGVVGDCIRQEAQAVDQGEVDRGTRGGFSAEVEHGLRVEREGPADEVDPAKDGREELEEIHGDGRTLAPDADATAMFNGNEREPRWTGTKSGSLRQTACRVLCCTCAPARVHARAQL